MMEICESPRDPVRTVEPTAATMVDVCEAPLELSAVSDLPDGMGPPTSPRRPYAAVALTVMVAAILVLYLVYQTYATFQRMLGMEKVPGGPVLPGDIPIGAILAWSFLLLVMLASTLICWLVGRALQRYLRLREISEFRAQAMSLQQPRHLRRGRRSWTDKALREQIDLYCRRAPTDDAELGKARTALRKALDTHCDTAMAIDQLQTCLLPALDQRADSLIRENAAAVALGTALAGSTFDSLIVLWRAFIVINGVASTYGSRPGVLGSLRLLRRGMYITVAAGIADQVADAVTGFLSNKAAAALSGRGAQGIGNGVMLLRFGEAIKSECRPLPVHDRSTLRQQLAALLSATSAIWSKGDASKDTLADSVA